MNASQLLDQLRQHDTLTTDQHHDAEQALQDTHTDTPWFVSLLLALSAWLASLLSIGFVVTLGMINDLEFLFGLILIVVAWLVRRTQPPLFFRQLAVAIALTGQALMLLFTGDFLSGSIDPEFQLSVSVALHSLLFMLFPDRLHRVLSLLFIHASVVGLVLLYRVPELMPLLAAVPALGLSLLWHYRPRLLQRRLGEYVWPLEVGLSLAGVGLMMLSCLYLLPDISRNSVFPNPWISTLLLAPSWFWLSWRLHAALGARPGWRTVAVAGALLIATLPMPGALFGLLLLSYGLISHRQGWLRIGLGFLAVFVFAFFYGNQLSMPVKAATLIASGAFLLWLRRHRIQPLLEGSR